MTVATATLDRLEPVPIDGRAAAERLQAQWARILSQTAAGYAYLTTLGASLEGADLAAAVGPANLQASRAYVLRFKQDAQTAQKLSDGSAVLVSYRDATGVHIGAYPAERVTPSLGVVWAYVALATGAVLAAAYFYFRDWELELEQMARESDALFLKVAETMAQTTATVAQTDPVTAARMAEANAQALKVAADARQAPQSWIDKILGGGGGGWFWLLAAGLAYAAFGGRK